MNLYLNYAQEHLTFTGESDPIGIILRSDKDDAVVKYATGGINAKVMMFRSSVAKAARFVDAARRDSLPGVIRKATDNQLGTIVISIVIDDSEDAEHVLSQSSFSWF